MFTGIIQAVGKVVEFRASRLRVTTPWSLRKGESVAVDGACLTVTARRGRQADFDVGPQTRRLTTLRSLQIGSRVNLERALRVGDRLGGHWVTGHVEGTGRIVAIEPERNARWITLQLPPALGPALLPKGSLAVDGISLTIAEARGSRARFMIIPHTWKHTSLASKKTGDFVNVETDLLARYALRGKK